MPDLSIYPIDAKLVKRFAESVEEHRNHVREFGLKFGLSLAQLEAHDLSKYSEAEFCPYALQHYGPELGFRKTPAAYSHALLHHYHHNEHHPEHHPEHWILPNLQGVENADCEHGIIRMPTEFVLEMVADWQAASIVYSGVVDMGNWLLTKMPKLVLHPDSRKELVQVLGDIGYKELFISKQEIESLDFSPRLDWLVAKFLLGYDSLWTSETGEQYAYAPNCHLEDDRQIIPCAQDAPTLELVVQTMFDKFSYHLTVQEPFDVRRPFLASFQRCGKSSPEYFAFDTISARAIYKAALMAYFQHS